MHNNSEQTWPEQLVHKHVIIYDGKNVMLRLGDTHTDNLRRSDFFN
jgi:hypothetical protein